MDRIIRITGILATSIILIAATGGYSIYRHFCNCNDAILTSVFLKAQCDPMEENQAEKSCCAKEKTERSCCNESPGNESKGKSPKNCCQTYYHFLKIYDSFSPGQTTSLLNVTYSTVFVVENEIDQVTVSSCDNDKHIPGPSPPSSGKRKLLEIHQLKLSPELG